MDYKTLKRTLSIVLILTAILFLQPNTSLAKYSYSAECVLHLQSADLDFSNNSNIDVNKYSEYEKLEKNIETTRSAIESLHENSINNLENFDPTTQNKIKKELLVVDNLRLQVLEFIDQKDLLLNQLLSEAQFDITQLGDLSKANMNLYEEYKTSYIAIHNILNTSPIQSTNFDDVIEDPKKIIAGHKYSLNLSSGDYDLIFAKNIVEEILLKTNTISTTILSRNLRDAKKGVFGSNYNGTGIIYLQGAKKVIEIRSRGKGGNFRFFGYVYNNEIHIVTYTTSSNHNSSLYKSIIERVDAIRSKRSHF